MNRADKKVLEIQKRFGGASAATGRFIRTENVIPTGILALDYALGTGGWPCGSPIEIFGQADIGKSLIALQAVREAQRLGKLCGWVAVEPGFDATWAEKHEVNMDELIVTWPNDGLDAFNQMQMMLEDDDIELVIFDSIGAILRPTEAELKGSPSQGGQAGLITWGVKRAHPIIYKKDKFLILINQVRDVMSSHMQGVVDSPGGRALKHTCEIRIQLKPGTERYTTKIDGNDVMIGREIIAEIKRTKRDEGTGKRAVFDFYAMRSENAPFGLDIAKDIINTGMRLNIIERNGAWYKYESFPDGQLMGKDRVEDWLKENPEKIYEIRQKVIDKIR